MEAPLLDLLVHSVAYDLLGRFVYTVQSDSSYPTFWYCMVGREVSGYLYDLCHQHYLV